MHKNEEKLLSKSFQTSTAQTNKVGHWRSKTKKLINILSANRRSSATRSTCRRANTTPRRPPPCGSSFATSRTIHYLPGNYYNISSSGCCMRSTSSV